MRTFKFCLFNFSHIRQRLNHMRVARDHGSHGGAFALGGVYFERAIKELARSRMEMRPKWPGNSPWVLNPRPLSCTSMMTESFAQQPNRRLGGVGVLYRVLHRLSNAMR